MNSLKSIKQLKKARQITVMLLSFVFLLSFCFGQNEPAVKKEKLDIDKKSEEILKKVSDFYAAQKTVQVKVIQETKMDMQGQKNESKREFEVLAEKPNKLFLKSLSGEGQTIIDVKKMYAYREKAKQYTEKDAPADFVPFIKGDERIDGVGRFGNNVLLALTMLSKNPYDTLTQTAEKIEYKGQEDIAGVKQDHLKISEKTRDFDLWIKSGDKPLIIKSIPDMEKFMKSRGREGQGKMDITVSFENWKFDEKIPQEKFSFTPGKDDKKVDAFPPGRWRPDSSATRTEK